MRSTPAPTPSAADPRPGWLALARQAPAASAAQLLVQDDCPTYRQFHAAVAEAQVAAWMPRRPSTVLDLSADPFRFGTLLTGGGHRVVPVTGDADLARGLAGCPDQPPGLRTVVGDPRSLDWFAGSSVDALLAEGGALSRAIATEQVVLDAARVLRPGGRMLVCVDSLLLGLARLAEQRRWQELADAPVADVVLIQEDDGGFRRFFSPEELREMLTAAGLEVDWVRPRTVLPPSLVRGALDQDPQGLAALVATELRVAAEREGEALGMQLVAAARRPAEGSC